MRTIPAVLILVSAVAAADPARGRAQQRPNFSGGWTATKEAEAGVTVAPTPVFGARFWLRHDGDRFTMLRPIRDTAVELSHRLDGAEVRTAIPGASCMGDTATVGSTAWEDNAIVYRTLALIPAGGGTPIKSGTRQVFKLQDADTLIVESVMRLPGQTEFTPVATVYKRTTEQPPSPVPVAVKLAPATLARVPWISGTWIGTTATTTYEERWSPANGGAMLATSRTLRNGAMTEFEFLCIAERAGSLVYTAMPNGRSPATDFMLTAVDDASATFENPSHDFPKMIRYALKPDGTLEATISAGTGQRATTFVFRKQ